MKKNMFAFASYGGHFLNVAEMHLGQQIMRKLQRYNAAVEHAENDVQPGQKSAKGTHKEAVVPTVRLVSDPRLDDMKRRARTRYQ